MTINAYENIKICSKKKKKDKEKISFIFNSNSHVKKRLIEILVPIVSLICNLFLIVLFRIIKSYNLKSVVIKFMSLTGVKLNLM